MRPLGLICTTRPTLFEMALIALEEMLVFPHCIGQVFNPHALKGVLVVDDQVPGVQLVSQSWKTEVLLNQSIYFMRVEQG